MSEIITIEVGQAGLQLSNAHWELFCMEHGIRSDGTNIPYNMIDNEAANKMFFQKTESDLYVPRSVKIDMEPTVIDEIKVGAYRNLFNPNNYISGFEDAGSNFARGYYTNGSSYMPKSHKIIRRLVEQCDRLGGFAVFNSYDGGTGSGLTARLSDELSTTFSKTAQIQIGIFPSPRLSSSTVFPYNAVLHTATATIEKMDICAFVENESLYDICKNKLNLKQPTFSHINRLIAQTFSNLTVTSRFTTYLNNDLCQFMTNLVPYPSIHFLIASLSPIYTEEILKSSSTDVASLTNEAFSLDNQFAATNNPLGVYMACLLQYRGDIRPLDVRNALNFIKNISQIRFVDWCPTGFKVGLSTQPPASPPGSHLASVNRSLTLFMNNSMITNTFINLISKFDLLYSRKAFFQWFTGEGLEESELEQARNKIFALVDNYTDICDIGINSGQSSPELRNTGARTPNSSRIGARTPNSPRNGARTPNSPRNGSRSPNLQSSSAQTTTARNTGARSPNKKNTGEIRSVRSTESRNSGARSAELRSVRSAELRRKSQPKSTQNSNFYDSGELNDPTDTENEYLDEMF